MHECKSHANSYTLNIFIQQSNWATRYGPPRCNIWITRAEFQGVYKEQFESPEPEADQTV